MLCSAGDAARGYPNARSPAFLVGRGRLGWRGSRTRQKKVTKIVTIETSSPEQTLACGRQFSSILKVNDIVLLEGALGGGKTTFVKGVMAGLGYTKRVLSPSFSLLRQYRLKSISVNHLDLYRLSAKEAANEEFQEYLHPPWGDYIILVEWGGKIEDRLETFIKVEFHFLSENKRRLIFSFK